MVVIHVDDDGQFEGALRDAGTTRLVVCDFFAHWCGPCRFIAPVFEQLSEKYSDAVFLKIDVDRCQMASQLYVVRAMPTFIALINRREIGRIAGADANGLERLIVANLPASSTGSTSSAAKKSSDLMATKEERAWLDRFLLCVDQVKQYEDEINQTLALSLVSIEDLRVKSSVNGNVNQYELAKNLMNWFHDSFFTWVNNPKCEKCNLPSVFAQNVECKPEERDDGANRVELFKCNSCSGEERFPRYQNVIKLLETRRGRCGEWANCFALFCRAVGLDTRWVTDNLDHVWVEIWSDDLDRWVHLDPCENVIDTPLMYEKGWGKKYAYVFAFAVDHVRDVTWRYCYNHKAAVARRKNCREAVLRNFLNKLNVRLSRDLPKERQEHLISIYMKELVEFLSPKLQLRDGSEAENQGRKSGSVAWRTERGELTTESASGNAPTKTSTVVKPTENELREKRLIIKYDCVNDEYSRPNNSSAKMKGWLQLCNDAKDIFRKVENDWKMSYLCRKIGSASGSITWKVDLSGTNAVKAEVNLGELVTFKTGQLMATVCCGDSCAMVPNDSGLVTLDDIKGAEYLEVRVDFSGGEGDCAWQHTQLFRTSHSEARDNFVIQVDFA